jgi:hypothetical protein
VRQPAVRGVGRRKRLLLRGLRLQLRVSQCVRGTGAESCASEQVVRDPVNDSVQFKAKAP